MEREVAALERGVRCCSWNHCGRRLAVGWADGSVAIHDSSDTAGPFHRSSKWPAHESSIMNVIWVPPEFGDAVACICVDGTLALWEEIEEEQLWVSGGTWVTWHIRRFSSRNRNLVLKLRAPQPLTWKLCKIFESSSAQVLDVQFGISLTNLKLVAAYSDGCVKVYELMDPLELNKWQLQAEFQNVIDSVSTFGKPACVSACIAWNPRRGESKQSSFVLGFNSDLSQFNSSKIWEFEDAHQRWLPIAELGLPEDKGARVHAIAWAPNIGRPYELIAIATCKGIAICHVGLSAESDGRLSTKIVALLSSHDTEVWQLEWDMSGMTLASTGGDGMVRLWQSNLTGVWHEQAVLECSGIQP